MSDEQRVAELEEVVHELAGLVVALFAVMERSFAFTRRGIDEMVDQGRDEG